MSDIYDRENYILSIVLLDIRMAKAETLFLLIYPSIPSNLYILNN